MVTKNHRQQSQIDNEQYLEKYLDGSDTDANLHPPTPGNLTMHNCTSILAGNSYTFLCGNRKII